MEISQNFIKYYHDECGWILTAMSTEGNKRSLTLGPRKEITYENCIQKFNSHSSNFTPNIGILTGKRSNLIVVDADDHKNKGTMRGTKWWMYNVNSKVIAPKVKSPTGEGFHFYFEWCEELDELSGTNVIRDERTGKLVQIDILSKEHLVMAPPSIWNGKEYKWEENQYNNLFTVGVGRISKYLLNKLIENHKNNRIRIPSYRLNTTPNPTFKNKITIQILRKIINSVGSERADNYDDWIKVGFILINSAENIVTCVEEDIDIHSSLTGNENTEISLNTASEEELFSIWDEWSSRSSKYNESEVTKIWNSFVRNGARDKGVGIGTLMFWLKEDNSDEYRNLFPRLKKNNLEDRLEKHNVFLSSENIPNVTFNTYSQRGMRKYFFPEGKDTLAIQACMGQGKTKAALDILSGYLKILIVSFRKSLDRNYVEVYKNLKFEIYLDIKSNTYDLDVHNKIVVQIDSLGKVVGKPDLIIFDEMEYSLDHFITFVSDKNRVHDALISYIKNTSKILIMDAFITRNTIKFLSSLNRKIHVEVNEFKTHVGKESCFIEKKRIFINSLKSSINEGEKIIFVSNCKRELDEIGTMLKDEFPLIKWKIITSDTINDTEIDNSITNDWDQMDFVGFSPSIVAGISFEKKHFDVCYGYFTPNSCHAEMACQQLFRVRDLKNNKFIIFVDECRKIKEKLPTSKKEIGRMLCGRNRNIKNTPEHYLKVDNYNKEVVKDTYYNLYRNCTQKQHFSKNDYKGRLIRLLSSQGVKITFNNSDIEDVTEKKEIDCKIKEIKLKTAEEKLESFLAVEPVDGDKFLEIKNKKVTTFEERTQLKKYNLSTVYGVKQEELNKEFVKKYNDKNRINQYKYLKYFDGHEKPLEDMERAIEIEKEAEENMTVCEVLNLSRWHTKLYIASTLLLKTGFYTPFNKNKIKKNEMKFKEVLDYLIEMKELIMGLFGGKNIELEKLDVRNDEDRKAILNDHVNRILRIILGISIRKDIHNNDYFSYHLSGMNFWNNKLLLPFNKDRDPVKFINTHYKYDGNSKTKLKDIYTFYNECWPPRNKGENITFIQFTKKIKLYYAVVLKDRQYAINVKIK